MDSRSPGRTRRDRAQGGFTLIELLIAMTITVIGLLGLMSLHGTTARGNRAAARMVTATSVAQQTMEELRALPIETTPPSPRSLTGQFGPLPIANAAMTDVMGQGNVRYVRNISAQVLTTTSADLIRIRIEIRWADEGADPLTGPAELRHMLAFEMIRTRQEML